LKGVGYKPPDLDGGPKDNEKNNTAHLPFPTTTSYACDKSGKTTQLDCKPEGHTTVTIRSL
jgi:hypothetical protein